MNPQLLPATPRDDGPAWERTLYAFLAEKERRSGSRRTVESYARMLWPFFGRVGSPETVTPAHVLAWGPRRRCFRPRALLDHGRRPDRLSLLLLPVPHPDGHPLRQPVRCPRAAEDRHHPRPRLQRGRGPRASRGRARYGPRPAGSGDPADAGADRPAAGRSDRLASGRRELPRPAYEGILATLADAGKELATIGPAESLWQAGARERGITSGTFYSRFRCYLRAAGLAPTGLHVLRHTAAKLRRDAGSSVEAVSAFLDHSSLAVTTTYLRRLEGESDRTWPDVAVAIGL